MKNTKIFLIAALLGSVMAGCQTEIAVEPVEKPVDNTPWTLTVNAAMDPVTKAMSLDGNTLKAYWADKEKVGVYLGGTKLGTIEVAEITNEPYNTEAILTGTLNTIEGLKVNDEIMLLFPDKNENVWSYLGQDGSAPSESGTMAKGYDYATATLTVAGLDNDIKNVVPKGTAEFVNQQSIFRFGFNMAMSSFTVYSAQNQLVTSRAFDGSDWVSTTGPLVVTPGDTEATTYFVSIRNENKTVDDRLYFSYIGDGNALYEGSQKIKTVHLGDGKFLGANVTMAQKTLEQASEETISNASDVL